MADAANKDECDKCLQIARAALQAGNLDKANRFASKAMRLAPSDEVRKVLRAVKSRQDGEASTSGAPPASMNGAAGGTHSMASSTRQRAPRAPEDRSTLEQRSLVASILRTKDFYEILGVAKTASEDDIKKAYRKLALKLHPDKNTAPRADEAFKAVSKAFSCLSDGDKRAAYDRFGEDEPGIRRSRSQGGFGTQGFDDFDPQEIFNMFFNGGIPTARRGPVFRTHFGGRPRPQQPQQPAQELPFGGQLLHLLPILLLLVFTFFVYSPSDPVYSLDKQGDYTREIISQHYAVPYYVKSSTDFDRIYPLGSRNRLQLEHEAESSFRDYLDRRCWNERASQQRLYRSGHRQHATSMELPACDELFKKFGNNYAQRSVFAF